MAEEKKIRFSGDASGLSSTFQKLKEDSRSLNKGLIEDAMKFSKHSKEQLSYIEGQIKAIERRNSLFSKSSRLELDQTYSSKLSGASPLQRDSLDKSYKEQVKQFNQDKKTDELQVSLLKDIVEAIKETSKQEIAQDKQSVKQTSDKILKDVSKGNGDKYTPEEILKATIQNDALKKKKEESGGASVFSQTFAAVTLSNMLSRAGSSLNTFGSAANSDEVIQSLAGGFGDLSGAAGGAYGRSVREQFNRQKAGFLLKGTFGDINTGVSTDISEGGSSKVKYPSYITSIKSGRARAKAEQEYRQKTQKPSLASDSITDYQQLGLTGTDLLELENEVLRSGNYSSDIQNNPALYAMFTESLGKRGVGKQSTLGLLKSMKISGKSPDNLGSIISNFERAGVISQKGNMFPLEGIYDSVSNLNSVFGQSSTQTGNTAANTLLGFNSLGGRFSVKDPRNLQMMTGLQQNLTNPQDDFAQASNFAALRDTLGPNASFFEMLKAQEKGFSGDQGIDFFKNIVGQITSRGGDTGNQAMALQSRFKNLTLEDAENVISNSDKIGSQKFLEGGGQDIIKKVMESGKGLTSLRDTESAQITDAFVKGASEGVLKVGKLFSDKVVELLGELTDSMINSNRN